MNASICSQEAVGMTQNLSLCQQAITVAGDVGVEQFARIQQHNHMYPVLFGNSLPLLVPSENFLVLPEGSSLNLNSLNLGSVIVTLPTISTTINQMKENEHQLTGFLQPAEFEQAVGISSVSGTGKCVVDSVQLVNGLSQSLLNQHSLNQHNLNISALSVLSTTHKQSIKVKTGNSRSSEQIGSTARNENYGKVLSKSGSITAFASRRNSSGLKKYSCDKPNCTFSSMYQKDLDRHVRTHTGEKPFVCGVCNKAFSRTDKLKLHLRGHAGEKPYKCLVCSYETGDSSSLKKHTRIHTNERPFKCQICTYASRNSSQLTVHLRTHTGDSPFLCQVCNAKFKINSDLKRHIRLHSGERPYKCEMCDYRCAIKGNLKSHYQFNHSKNVLECKTCFFTSSSRRAYHEHLKIHSTKPTHQCSLVDKSELIPVISRNGNLPLQSDETNLLVRFESNRSAATEDNLKNIGLAQFSAQDHNATTLRSLPTNSAFGIPESQISYLHSDPSYDSICIDETS